MCRTVLVTGGGGFIGSHVVARQLSLGRRVRALDLHLDRFRHLHGGPAGQVASQGLELVQGDFTDPVVQQRAVRDIDLVFHLASAHLEVIPIHSDDTIKW